MYEARNLRMKVGEYAEILKAQYEGQIDAKNDSQNAPISEGVSQNGWQALQTGQKSEWKSF